MNKLYFWLAMWWIDLRYAWETYVLARQSTKRRYSK